MSLFSYSIALANDEIKHRKCWECFYKALFTKGERVIIATTSIIRIIQNPIQC